MKKLFSILFFICSSQVFGSEVLLKVNAPWASNQSLTLNTYSDFFTYTEEIIKKAVFNNKGEAQFTLELPETKQVLIGIGNVRSAIYLSPNQIYEVVIPKPSQQVIGSLSKDQYVIPQFNKQDTERINQKVQAFNKHIDEFLRIHAIDILHKRMKPIVQKELKAHQEKMQTESSAFFRQYTEYVYAGLLLTGNYSRGEVQAQFIENRPVLLNNPEYVKFFKDFYSDYIRFFATKSYETRINAAVNVHGNIDSLASVFLENKYLKRLSPQEFELVLINEVYHQANNERFDKKNIIQLLKQVSVKSVYEANKRVTSAMLKKIAGLGIGMKAPEIYYTDVEENSRKLSDLQGKYVYLDFWATWCTPCLKEMVLMEKLYQTYGNSIEFLSLSLDRNEKKMEQFLSKKGYTWQFGYVGESGAFKEAYKVVALPRYFLIDPEGYLVQAPAKSPTQGIEFYFKEIISQNASENKEKGIWELKEDSFND